LKIDFTTARAHLNERAARASRLRNEIDRELFDAEERGIVPDELAARAARVRAAVTAELQAVRGERDHLDELEFGPIPFFVSDLDRARWVNSKRQSPEN
jgi:vacuolar-type H+-ATPase subunit I/STV1